MISKILFNLEVQMMYEGFKQTGASAQDIRFAMTQYGFAGTRAVYQEAFRKDYGDDQISKIFDAAIKKLEVEQCTSR